ncbi:MAG TPA: hypothetical protein PLF22_01035 [Pseudomonadales bacterium]|nr:hypothetical protein [Pseudomonadales bacterium]
MARAHRGDDMDDTDDMGMDLDVAEEVTSGSADVSMASSREDAPEARSVTSRCRIREQLQRDMEAFLAHGGAINHVETHVMAPEHPRRPVMDYGF